MTEQIDQLPPIMREYAGADWLEQMRKNRGYQPLTTFGRLVAEILGAVYRGIYHIDSGQTLRDNFIDDGIVNGVSVTMHRTPSTYDFSELTELVILCHAYSVRLEISARTVGYLTFRFHRRQPPKEGDQLWQRHPSLAQACERLQIDPAKFYCLPKAKNDDATQPTQPTQPADTGIPAGALAGGTPQKSEP